jgi:Holliday junction resolvasome RuvABC endonuclease subunit
MPDRPPEIVMALDLATTTGWCVGPAGGKPTYGSQRLGSPGATSGEVFAAFLGWLVDAIKVHDPRVLCFEAPLAPSHMGGETNANTARRLLGLPAICEAVAYRMRVPVILEAHVRDVRKHFIGNGSMPGAQAKLAVRTRCQMLGYDPQGYDASDAIAVWDYTCAMRNQKIAAQQAMERGFT